LVSAEFLSLNKPVLAWNDGHDLNHLDMLKDSGLLYNDSSHLNQLIRNLPDFKEDWTKHCFYSENNKNKKHKEFLFFKGSQACNKLFNEYYECFLKDYTDKRERD
jgi:hypothetical protein